MNTLGLTARRLLEGRGKGVALIIDGRDLLERVRIFEGAFALDLAGKYDPIPATVALPPSGHLLGSPTPLYSDGHGRSYVLMCECGEPGCWPLAARIALSDATVTWTDFRQPHRPQWSYQGFGPFVFDRVQYEAALADAAAAFGKPDV